MDSLAWGAKIIKKSEHLFLQTKKIDIFFLVHIKKGMWTSEDIRHTESVLGRKLIRQRREHNRRLRGGGGPIFSRTLSIRKVPVEVWKEHICQFLNLEDLTILRRTNTFFQKYWVSVLEQNVIRVPQGCPTVEKAMDLAVIFSKYKEYRKEKPLTIQLEEGEHEVVAITTSNWL